MSAPAPTSRRQRGSALIVILILGLLLAGFAASFMSRGIRETRAGAGYRASSRARAAVEALLARARTLLRTSQIDATGRNFALADALSTGEIRRLADGTPATNEISGGEYRRLLLDETGTVWVTRLEGDYFRIEAQAEVGYESANLAATLRERTPVTAFQRFATGVGTCPAEVLLVYGQEPFLTGDIIQVTPAPTELEPDQASNRREDIEPVPPPDLPVPYPRDPPGPYEIPMPDDALYVELLDLAGFSYDFPAAEGYMVTLLGENIRVQEYTSIGPAPPPVELPVPDEGVLYVRSDILSLEGDFHGRMTIVSLGTIHVTGSIRYVDTEGHPRMLGGADPDTTFEPNPDYSGDTALGIVARGSVYYAPAMPPSSEIDAALFAHTGTIGLQMFWYDEAVGLNESGFGVPIYYDDFTAQGKASLKELGAKISAGVPSSAVQGTSLGFGTIVSRYDEQLRESPPPGFPSFPLMLETVARNVGGVEGLTPGATRMVTRRTSDRIPTGADAEHFQAVRDAVENTYGTFGVSLGGGE